MDVRVRLADVRERLWRLSARYPETLKFLAMFIVLALMGYAFTSYVDQQNEQQEKQAREELALKVADTERQGREELRMRINAFARSQCLASRQEGSTLRKFNQAMLNLGQPGSVLPVPSVEQCGRPIIPPPAGNPGTRGEE